MTKHTNLKGLLTTAVKHVQVMLLCVCPFSRRLLFPSFEVCCSYVHKMEGQSDNMVFKKLLTPRINHLKGVANLNRPPAHRTFPVASSRTGHSLTHPGTLLSMNRKHCTKPLRQGKVDLMVRLTVLSQQNNHFRAASNFEI
jgi:hypothetical protein